jgi:hypothetical protein
MAGKIVADTLEHSTAGSVTTDYVVNGSAKQWSNYSGSGTTLRDSFNTASATDNGTGQYTITLVSAMSTNDNAYTYSNSGGSSESEAFTTGGNRQFSQIRVPATSSYGIQPIGDAGAQQDCGLNCSQVMGDLA